LPERTDSAIADNAKFGRVHEPYRQAVGTCTAP